MNAICVCSMHAKCTEIYWGYTLSSVKHNFCEGKHSFLSKNNPFLLLWQTFRGKLHLAPVDRTLQLISYWNRHVKFQWHEFPWNSQWKTKEHTESITGTQDLPQVYFLRAKVDTEHARNLSAGAKRCEIEKNFPSPLLFLSSLRFCRGLGSRLFVVFWE